MIPTRQGVTTTFKRPNETTFINFPENVNPINLKVASYVCGERFVKPPESTLDIFDTVSYFNSSRNKITGKLMIHAIGYRQREHRTTFLNLKEILEYSHC